jgi:hypothetical protein
MPQQNFEPQNNF